MGKNKKTRWRTFSFDGSKDETQINGDVKVNGTTDLNSLVNSQKYSQILGDHHTNYLSHNKSTTSATAAVHHNFKTRSYNKENYYNQRSVVKNNLALKNSWQRSNSSAFRATASSLKDNSSNKSKSEENEKRGFSDNEKQDCNSQITTEPIKFNEDEYTRITTPRQDVLFKKGYLSRMNSNKTANNTSTIVDSTGPNSITTTATNSDPESSLSVSTLSPATTPSMDYGQIDSQDYAAAAAPVYYPGYYDESGMLVFPIYNGYNYYPPNGSTSPVFLMPYPYQYDPFFMAPNTEVSTNDNTDEQEQPITQQNGDSESADGNEKAETDDDTKKNNQIALEEQNNNNDDNTGDGDDEKDMRQEQSEVTTTNEQNDQTAKQCFPIYANELGYVFPYANGFYNGFYYYNGIPAPSRPLKGKRRKRYSSSRSSQSHPPPPRSTAETTTDYSDDDGGNSTHNKRYYYSRYGHHNGWNHHNGNHHHHYSSQHHHQQQINGYNQYHYYNSKYYSKNQIDPNANQAPTVADTTTDKELAHHESNLNADVGEFYPRVHSNDSQPQQRIAQNEQELKYELSPATDLEKQQQQQQGAQMKTKSDLSSKSTNHNNNTKTSHMSKSMGRVSKKEIMDGIKLMEQQNINLKATSKAQLKMTSSSIDADVEWNVIKKGKKVKVVKDSQTEICNKSEPSLNGIIKKDSKNGAEEMKTKEVVVSATGEELLSQEHVSNKKTLPPSTQVSVTNNSTTITTNNNHSNNYNITKSKKSKNKGKKKKPFSMNKQEGFEIIEPDFSSNNDKENEEIANDASEEDDEATVVEVEEIMNDNNAIEYEKKEISSDSGHDEINENKNDVIVAIVEKQLFVDDERKQQKRDEVQQELLSDEIKVQEEILKVFNIELSQKSKGNNDDDAIIDISDEDICRKTSIEIDLSIAQEIAKIEIEPNIKQEKIVDEKSASSKIEEEEKIFEDSSYFSDRKNIAELERDLVENLKILDDGIDIKSPVINPLYDFPITSAVRKWLQEKQNESFENLFRVENFKKLSELYDECDEEEDDDESDISDSPQKSETTDSDYASDIQVKLNGSPASSNAKLDTKLTSKCNNKLIVKESFCALM